MKYGEHPINSTVKFTMKLRIVFISVMLASCINNKGYYDDAFIEAKIRISDVHDLIDKVAKIEARKKSKSRVTRISSIEGKKECRIGIMEGCYVQVAASTAGPYQWGGGSGTSYQFIFRDGRWIHQWENDTSWVN